MHEMSNKKKAIMLSRCVALLMKRLGASEVTAQLDELDENNLDGFSVEVEGEKVTIKTVPK